MPTAEEYYESAMMHLSNGDRNTAAIQLGQACLLKRDYHEAYMNRGNVLLGLGNTFDALLNYDRALTYRDDPSCHNNRGAALAALELWEEAEGAYRRALELKPSFEHCYTNLGNVLKLQDRLPEAQAAYEEAIKINDGYVDAHLNLSFAALEQGKYDLGWREFEWRWKSGQIPPRGLPYRQWQGEAIRQDEAILLYAEQGLGDALQFCRYAPEVKKRYGCRVYVEVRPALTRLLANGLDGVDGVLNYGDKIPDDVRWCAALMSCPLIFGHSVEDTPAPRQYLRASADRAKLFVPELNKLPPGPRVGLCWAGMSRQGIPEAAAIDKRRSTTLQALAPLAVPGVGWVSLQKGPSADQLTSPPRGMTILDCMPDCDDMADTAALVSQLDLVISVDTAVCHLAAALGRPTWVLSRKDSCWRWLRDRADSPWYPTVRHYRQTKQGDWDELTKRVAHDLRGWVMSWELRKQAA